MKNLRTYYGRIKLKLRIIIADASKEVQYSVQNIPTEYFIVALVAMVAYMVGYLWFPATPGNSEEYFIGWFGWSDQRLYLEAAKAIAHWSLSPATYVYPLGYPLLAAPFIKWLPRHPFFVPNLFFSIGIVLAFYASCRKLLTRIESIVLTFFLIILSGFTSTQAIAGGLIWFNSLIVPWNIIPVFFAAYIVTWLLVFGTTNFRKLWVASFAIALAFFARPSDAIFLGILYLAGLVDLKSLRKKLQGILILILPSLFVLVALLISKWVVFHSVISPYDVVVSEQGFNLNDLLFKFYITFFDGMPLYGYKELMLLPQMPWLLLCIPGVFLLTKNTNGKAWFLILAVAICLVIYISFNAQTPSNTFNYYGYRYFTWVFPWLGLGSYLTITRAYTSIGKWETIIAILVPVIFVLIIGWEEKVVATISASDRQSLVNLSQSYDPITKRFISEVSLSEPTSADGLKLVFSIVPTKNMRVAGDWQSFSLIIDGREQIFIHDYNLYQSDNNVYISFRNPINKIGQFQKAIIQYDNTAWPELDKIFVLRKEFKPFKFVEKISAPLGLFPIEWNISDDQTYNWGNIITMGVNGNSDPYKFTGWSDDELGYTWSEGHNALLGFKTQPVSSDLKMQLVAAGLVTPNLVQPVEIKVNGNHLTKLNLSNTRQSYDIDIPARYLRKDGILLIKFIFPNATSPFVLGINQDKRILAMAVYSLILDHE